MADEPLENKIRTLGHEIFARADRASGARNNPFHRLDDSLMNLGLRDQELKTQLFRFVDVLPALRDSGEISRHLREYLLEATHDRRSWRWAAKQIPGDGWLGPLVAAAAGWQVRRMARRFIAAADLPQAVAAIVRLRQKKLAFTLDLLGEAVVCESEAEQYQQQYLQLLQTLPAALARLPFDQQIDGDPDRPIPRANISLKLSSLFSQFDPIDPAGTTAAVAARLRPILRLARQQGAFINLDMEQWAFKDQTLAIFKSVLMEDEFRDWPDVGIAIQAYLRSVSDDLRGLADWARQRGTAVWVRLVKGAYWDFETVIAAQNDWPVPVYLNKAKTDLSFEGAAQFLIEHRAVLRPAIASHNIRSLAAAIAFARTRGMAASEIEFQMLYGMADPIKAALVQMGQRVRVYAPMGRLLPGMAYLVRRLLENTSNESFLRAGFVDRAPEERLLMSPLLQIRKKPAPPHPAGFTNAPPTDFSSADSREQMVKAIADYSPKDHPLLIDGQPVVTGQWIDSINPSHKSRIVGRCARAGVQEAQRAIAAAKSAFPAWRQTAPSQRAALLDRVADILTQRRMALVGIEVLECGKPWREADADIAEAIDFCRYYADQMRLLSQPQGKHLPGERNDWLYDPRGVAVTIAPWNFPLAILCGMSAAAVVTGNPVIMKPAEQSPIIAAHLAAAFTDAGAPPGVVNYLPGVGEEIGPALVEHPDVALIVFTGSRAVGLGINQSASVPRAGQDHVKRIIIEMGGKNAIIVDADADLDEAVNGIIASAFGYSGQKCSACSRVVAHETVHDVLLSRLIEAARSLRIAPAEDPGCRVGPVIDAEAFNRIQQAIQRGKQDARLAWAGDVGTLADEGFFIAPHIFSDVPPASSLASEEIFGPVLSVMRADGLDEALSLANGVSYALTGGVYSRSPGNIERCRREFRVGNLYINRKITGALVGRQPFGGFKLSGGGTQAGGPDYLRQFMLPRCITENTLRHGFVPDES
jgi:RHH-type proline utilization regulon transcriptional repressor/proline dehydrogenase/delta 1-pyrroline-5-carboxylate dehydrogenase